ncbi:MAG: hypothetical protein HYY85_20730 [Deltaproteobacteria bacterium]|nr:hypothetical protein [Deltaproteobacteria bacterium]
MITQEALERLAAVRDDRALITSLYLNVDGRHFIRREDYRTPLRELMREWRGRLEKLELTREERQVVQEDLDRLAKFVADEFERKGARGVAAFAAGALGLWEVYPLPCPVRNELVVDRRPYVRPLAQLLATNRRFCTVVVDRSKARVFEVFLGEIQEHSYILDEVPARVRAGGWSGYEEKRIEGHIAEHVHRHYKRVADVVQEFFRRRRFNFLILGGPRETLPEFERHLHTDLADRIAVRIVAEPDIPLQEVLARSLEVERDLRVQEEQRVVGRLLNEVGGKGFGVGGVRDTLMALKAGQVHTLLVQEERALPGRLCLACGFFDPDRAECPFCRTPLESVADVFEMAVGEAVRQGAQVFPVAQGKGLEPFGGLGALLRFR